MSHFLPPIQIASNISVVEATTIHWDTIVAGAGVSGSAAALHLASNHRKVLLVEAARFPRDKVCGGCLNQRAQTELQSFGLLTKLHEFGSVRIRSLQVCTNRHRSQWSIPTMLSIRRSVLDSTLVHAAMERGAQFLQQTRAKLSTNSEWEMMLQPKDGVERLVQTKTRILATGLSRFGLPRRTREDSTPWPEWIDPNSRIGVHCLIPYENATPIEASVNTRFRWSEDCLSMIVGQHGYLGICLTDGGMIDLAAAIDPSQIQRLGGIGACIASILHDCGLSLKHDPASLHWQSTPMLTRQSSRVAKGATFLLGDSLGYVEPFTGEGMSWSFSAAKQLIAFVEQTLQGESLDTTSARWEHWVTRHRKQHHRVARWVAGQSRIKSRASRVLTALDWMPPIRTWLMKKVMQ